MNELDGLSVREALRQHYAQNRMAADGGLSARYWTMLRLGRLRLRLPNFRWRQQALPVHDVHHLLTGYPCNPQGEFQMAAWEFAAGRFPHTAATLFCLPLVGMGAVLTPRRSFAAFVLGRQSQTLYARGLSDEVLALRVDELRQQHLPDSARPAGWRLRLEYLVLVGLSLGLMAAPVFILALLLPFL